MDKPVSKFNMYVIKYMCIYIIVTKVKLYNRYLFIAMQLLLLLLLLLLAAMTYNQVQSFQINDYANNYVDIEITGCRALYSKCIAGRA